MAKKKSRRAARRSQKRQQRRQDDDKRVIQSPSDDWRTQQPSWSLDHIRLDGPFGWRSIPHDDLIRVFNVLTHLAQEKWGGITTQSGNPHHLVSLDQISDEAKGDLEAAGLGDVDQVMSLRVGSWKRVLGFMELSTMHLLWWDPEHKVSLLKRFSQ